MIRALGIGLLLCWGVCAEEVSHCFFHPPEGWEMTNLTEPSSHVRVNFVKSRSQGFCPSINLAVEQTSVSLAEYLKAIKGIHEQDRSNQWRQLGKVHTAAGTAQLTQIDTSSEWGAVRILQLILVKEGHAYVLTAAALKRDFSKLYQEIQTAFRSLTLTPDLFQPIAQLEKKEALLEKKRQLTGGDDPSWAAFEQEVATHSQEMGAYWKSLVLKEAQEGIKNQLVTTTEKEK